MAESLTPTRDDREKYDPEFEDGSYDRFWAHFKPLVAELVKAEWVPGEEYYPDPDEYPNLKEWAEVGERRLRESLRSSAGRRSNIHSSCQFHDSFE